MKHTPGPWRVCNERSIHASENVLGNPSSAIGFALCGRPEFNEEVKANAQLMAASPELLAACETAFNAWRTDHSLLSPGIAQTLRSAIAKAHGLKIDETPAAAPTFRGADFDMCEEGPK